MTPKLLSDSNLFLFVNFNVNNSNLMNYVVFYSLIAFTKIRVLWAGYNFE